MADITVQNGGSIFLLTPKTDEGTAWIENNIGQDNGFQPYWPTVVVEANYVANILEGMSNDGLWLA